MIATKSLSRKQTIDKVLKNRKRLLDKASFFLAFCLKAIAFAWFNNYYNSISNNLTNFGIVIGEAVVLILGLFIITDSIRILVERTKNIKLVNKVHKNIDTVEKLSILLTVLAMIIELILK